jgi:hypothetical protein|tara:strand:+ start:7177 stop:7494 length:318 start_codon:yes stop_codon:yes gene_type:complete
MKQWIKWQDLYLLPKWWSIAVWIAAILFYLSLYGCAHLSVNLTDREYFPLIDEHDNSHTYDKEYNIGLYDEHILYCATHHQWESIKGVWNTDDEEWEIKYRVRDK